MIAKLKKITDKILKNFYNLYHRVFFPGTVSYWEKRYSLGGNSGAGSYGNFAKVKSDFVNDFVKKHKIRSVVDLGCGDGNQIQFFNIPKYTGIDVKEAIEKCNEKFKNDKTKTFFVRGDFNQTAELAISLDVLMHLIEDGVFRDYMNKLFASATKFVIIHSPDSDRNSVFLQPHEKYRNFSSYIDKNIRDFRLSYKTRGTVPGTCFFVYEKIKR